MGYTRYLKRVLFRDSAGNGYVIPVTNLSVWYEPWHATGKTIVRYFHGKNSSRIHGYQGFCEFDMNFGYQGEDDATLSAWMNAITTNTVMTIDFDPDIDPGQKTMTVILDDVRGSIGANFDTKIRNRRIKLKLIDPVIRATIPKWTIGESGVIKYLIAFLAQDITTKQITSSVISSLSFSTFLQDDDGGTGSTFDIVSLEVDYVNSFIYWSQTNTSASGKLWKCQYDRTTGARVGSATLIKTEVSQAIRGIAVGTGTYSDFIFYSTNDNRLRRIKKDGTGVTTLYTGLSNPNDLVLDPSNGDIVICVDGVGKILLGNVDTLSLSTILNTGSDYGQVRVDFTTDQIWVRRNSNRLIQTDTYSTMAVNGSTLTTFVDVGGGASKCSFDIDISTGPTVGRVFFWDAFVEGAGTPVGIYSKTYAGAGYQQELNSNTPANFTELRLG